MARLAALILAALTCVGCTVPAHPNGVTFDGHVRGQRAMVLKIDDRCDVERVLDGAQTWLDAGLFRFDAVVEHGPRNIYTDQGTVICVAEIADIPPMEQIYPGETYLFADWGAKTAAHELGHNIGLPHSDDPDALMYWAPTADKPSAGDIETFWRLY